MTRGNSYPYYCTLCPLCYQTIARFVKRMILGFKSRDESCSLCNKYKYAAIVELVKPLEEILKEGSY